MLVANGILDLRMKIWWQDEAQTHDLRTVLHGRTDTQNHLQ
jgi:hypothetical protein